MALILRACNHASEPKTKDREKEHEALKARFPPAPPGTGPLIPAMEVFRSLYDVAVLDDGTLPSVAECAVHLEMLEAFFILKQKVLSSNALDRAFGFAPKDKITTVKGKPVRVADRAFLEARNEKWPMFVRLATSRYLEWAKSVDLTIKTTEIVDHRVCIDEMLPPLDVLLVWHAFILNTKNYREYCSQDDRSWWLDLNFPWKAIHEAMRDDNHFFSAPSRSKAYFTHQVGSFDLFATLADYNSHSWSMREALTELSSWKNEDEYLKATYPGLNKCNDTNIRISSVKLLSGMVERQTKFTDKMMGHLWLRSPALEGTMQRAITRYESFMQLFKDGPWTSLVPTLDIDLVWHTQQCSPTVYSAACRKLAGRTRPVAHDDQIEGQGLKSGFAVTRRLYETRFKEEYSLCLCWESEALRSELLATIVNTEAKPDIKKVISKVQLQVDYYKAAELARRTRQPIPVYPDELKI